jgi:hypothetical protein
MLKLFKKVKWNRVSASFIRPGDVVSDVFEGEVLYVHRNTYDDCTLVTLVINMKQELFGSKIATTTVPLDKKIFVAQR